MSGYFIFCPPVHPLLETQRQWAMPCLFDLSKRFKNEKGNMGEFALGLFSLFKSLFGELFPFDHSH